MLLPGDINDQQVAAAIKLLKGSVEVDGKTNYGPEGKDHYSEDAGYFTASVKRSVASPIRLELVDDSEVVSAREFDERVERFQQKLLRAAA